MNRFIKILSLLFIVSFFVSISAYALKYSNKAYSPNSYKERVLFEKKTSLEAIMATEMRIDEIDMDLLKLKADYEWLLLGIMRIEVQGKRIPLNMIQSKQVLEDKKRSLLNERKELLKWLRVNIDKLNNLNNEVVKRFSGTPDWWIIPPEIMKEFKAPAKKSEKVKSDTTTKKAIPKKSTKPKSTNPAKAAKIKVIKNGISRNNLTDWVEFVDSKWGMRVETRLPILFASGKYSVSDEYGDFFKNLSAFIKEYDVTVKVEGFSDKSKVKEGALAANFAIGAQRAVSVVNELLNYGVNPKIVTVTTRGEHGLYIAGNSKRSRALSRRVQITVYFKK